MIEPAITEYEASRFKELVAAVVQELRAEPYVPNDLNDHDEIVKAATATAYRNFALDEITSKIFIALSEVDDAQT